MARPLPTGMVTALTAVEVAAAFLVELDWPDGTVYLWNGYHDLIWGGQTWIGVGHLGGISEVKESADLGANGCLLSLSGIPSAVIAEALRNDSQGRPGKIYFGVLNVDGFSIDPYLVFDGLIDAPSINDDGNTATISIPLEKEMLDNRSGFFRYTDQDQQFKFAGDLGCQYVAGLANTQFTWGKATVYPSTPPGSGDSDGTVSQFD